MGFHWNDNHGMSMIRLDRIRFTLISRETNSSNKFSFRVLIQQNVGIEDRESGRVLIQLNVGIEDRLNGLVFGSILIEDRQIRVSWLTMDDNNTLNMVI